MVPNSPKEADMTALSIPAVAAVIALMAAITVLLRTEPSPTPDSQPEPQPEPEPAPAVDLCPLDPAWDWRKAESAVWALSTYQQPGEQPALVRAYIGQEPRELVNA
jgi:hypothetical protein